MQNVQERLLHGGSNTGSNVFASVRRCVCLCFTVRNVSEGMVCVRNTFMHQESREALTSGELQCIFGSV